MRTIPRLILTAVGAATLVPSGSAAAQVGVAAKVGTTGVGAEIAFDLSPRVSFRGGAALVPVNFDSEYSGVRYDVDFPDSFLNVGLDLHLGGGFRIGGGLLFKPDEPELEASFSGPIEIGGETFTEEEVGSLLGGIDGNEVGPFLLVGYGRHTGSGLGFFIDAGAAYLGDTGVVLGATGTLAGDPDFQRALARESASIEAELGNYLKFYPVLQIGLRFGFGGR